MGDPWAVPQTHGRPISPWAANKPMGGPWPSTHGRLMVDPWGSIKTPWMGHGLVVYTHERLVGGPSATHGRPMGQNHIPTGVPMGDPRLWVARGSPVGLTLGFIVLAHGSPMG